MTILEKLFDGSFMPHGHCLLWREDLLLLHAGGGLITVLAYMIIPVGLIKLVRARKDLRFDRLFLMFASFIFLCGATHFINLINIWHGYYFIEGLLKTATGIVSITVAIMAINMLPKAIKVPSQLDLEDKVFALQRTEQQMADMNKTLEYKVIERTRQLEKIANTDALTGIFNRREILRILTVEVERNARQKLPLSVLMLDLDEFKNINDNHGHQAGDDVLIDFVNCMEEISRKTDFLGRLGGEEFLLILPNTDYGNAKTLAQRYKEKIEQEYVVRGGCKFCTVSIGVAEFDGETDDVESLIQKSDEALYKAKKAGRNSVA